MNKIADFIKDNWLIGIVFLAGLAIGNATAVCK